ncbi:MAG: MGH1-like glycoside hydrolase domain-containing protein [Candidatus Sumerlaeia bacterium]
MSEKLTPYIDLIKQHICRDFHGMYREAGEGLPYPFLTPGSEQYDDVLWDWDSWWSNIALRQVLKEVGESAEYEKALPYERGCVQNFLSFAKGPGFVPIVVGRGGFTMPEDIRNINMHKPCLAQHAAFLIQQDGDAEWFREDFYFLQLFVNFYHNHHRHSCGLYYWETDKAIGVDNDPCTYGRPAKSSGSIYLNTMMYRELLATAWIAEQLNLDEIAGQYRQDAENLKQAIQEYCWDERDGFFYSVDLNIRPDSELQEDWGHNWGLHCGYPVDWPCLIQRIGVWSGFMGLWSGVATDEQAERVVQEHYYDSDTFGAEYGVRTLSKMEKMYNVRGMGNPSSWLGPIWGIANYMTFRGFVRYRQNEAARDLAEKTIRLFGRDFERFGALHEYYQPDNGEPILNKGFQNWNYLVLNMIAWLEGDDVVEEF